MNELIGLQNADQILNAMLVATPTGLLQSGKKIVNCPYCWAENEVESVENFKVVTSHPPFTQFSRHFSEVKVPFWMFWRVKYPKGVREDLVKCKNCGLNFYVRLFPYDSDDSKNSKDLNYHLKLIKGETEKIEKKFFLEEVMDRFCDLLHIKKEQYPLACFLFILIPCILFWILPLIVLGGFSKISHDYGFFFLFVLFVLMLILLKRHSIELEKILDFKKIPIFVSKQYKHSNLSKDVEESFKNWVFGYPFQKITSPTFCGIIAVIVFLIWQTIFIMNITNTFYETPYIGYPMTYTSYALAVLAIPFWAMIYFIMGNIIWIFMATTALIGLMTRHMPLEINPLKEMGGTEVFGKMMLSSLYPFAAFGAGIPIAVIWSSSQEFFVLLVCTLFVSLFVFLIAFGFFYPLWPIHKKLKERKETEQNEILSKISLSAIKEEGVDFKDAVHTHLLLDTSNKISSMLEWPFKTDTLIKACSAILVPFISLVINIVILFLKP